MILTSVVILVQVVFLIAVVEKYVEMMDVLLMDVGYVMIILNVLLIVVLLIKNLAYLLQKYVMIMTSAVLMADVITIRGIVFLLRNALLIKHATLIMESVKQPAILIALAKHVEMMDVEEAVDHVNHGSIVMKT